jgi:hypothetical protein
MTKQYRFYEVYNGTLYNRQFGQFDGLETPVAGVSLSLTDPEPGFQYRFIPPAATFEA